MEAGEIVQVVVEALVSFVAFGCLSVFTALPLRRFPTPQRDLPKGFGALECELIDGTSDVIAPISRRPCVSWQLEGRSVDAAFGPLVHATADWCDAIRVRLRSGNVLLLRLPESDLWISGERRLKGEVDFEWSRDPRTRGGRPRIPMEAFEETVLVPGDRLFVVGVFVGEDPAEDPMRRSGDAGLRASLARPARIPLGSYAAVLHGAPYAELGWRGRRARRWFFAIWPLWLGVYVFYALAVHVLPAAHDGRSAAEKASEQRGVETR